MIKKTIRKISIILIFMLFMLPFICIGEQLTVALAGNSDTIIDSASAEYKTDSLWLTMDKGEITIRTENHAASTKYRWKTVGFVITEKPLESTSTTISDITSSGMKQYKFLYSKDACDKKDATVGDVVRTIYTIDKQTVKEKLSGLNMDQISQTKYLYIHAIFQTYKYIDKDTHENISGYLYNWRDIAYYRFEALNNQTWGDETRGDFYKYYNMKLEFSPGRQDVEVVYKYDFLDKSKADEEIVKFTEQKYINESMTEYVAKKSETYKKSNFTYQDTKVYLNDDSGTLYTASPGYTSGNWKEYETKTQITYNAKVPYGGLKIVVYYKEDDNILPITYTREAGIFTSNGEFQKSITFEKNKKFTAGESAKEGTIFSWEKQKNQYLWNGKSGSVTENQLGENIYDLAGYYVSYVNGTEDTPVSDAEAAIQGSEVVEHGGIVIHFIYTKADWSKHPVSYVREWSDGTVFVGKDGPVAIGMYELESLYHWKVKKKIFQTSSGTWSERASGTGEGYHNLVRTYIVDAVDKTLFDSNNGESMYEGDVKVKTLGIVIHYVYDNPPENIVTPTPVPEIPDEVVPTPAIIDKTINTPETEGIIRADDRGSEKFIATEGVPTTESLYVQVKGSKYMLGYTFTKKTGIARYSIPVSRDYILIWKNATKTETKVETKTIETTVTIERAYGYWEITQLDYYTIDSTTVSNYALPDGSVTIKAKDNENPIPSLTYLHSSRLEDHVITPVEVYQGVKLPSIILDSGNSTKPVISYSVDEMKYLVNERMDKVTVVNDYFNFGGTTYIDNSPCKYDTGMIDDSNLRVTVPLSNENVLYQNDYVIEAVKLNGTYPSNGVIKYKRIANINSYYSDLYIHPINVMNPVVIHTPVICNPIVQADNDKYVQLIQPSNNCVHLVLDENETLNDFTLQISNYALHMNLLGYYTRDFSYNLHGGGDASYIMEQLGTGVLRNEVKFPFDVYMHQGDGSQEYVKKNTWIAIGRSKVTYHLPMWVNEGIYTVDCRTIAVNADDTRISKTEVFRNQSRDNYVATNSFDVEVSGRIYGMNIYDITDDTFWKEVFRENQSLGFKINAKEKYSTGYDKSNYSKNFIYNYTTGVNDCYGNSTKRFSKYTFPLVNGSHPYYKNIGILKKGYAIRFSLESTGNLYSDACKVIIKPTFWHVDKNGENRTRVDLYYSEDINGKFSSLVKVGSGIDQVNLKQIRTGDVYLGIPKLELTNTAALRDVTYKKFISQVEAMYQFSKISLNYAFRTYVNQDYAKDIFDQKNGTAISNTGIKESDISIRKQRWYGEYYIPGSAMAVKSGYNVYDYANKYGVNMKEDFWLNDGYIIVNFDIYTIDQEGNQRLSYTNASNYLNQGNCCMWELEGYQLEKTSYDDTVFGFKYGDVLIYYANQSVNSDYVVGGTH